MLSLVPAAVGVALMLTLAAGAYAASRTDGLDYRTAVLAAAVAVAVGGAAVTAVSVAPAGEPAAADGSEPRVTTTPAPGTATPTAIPTPTDTPRSPSTASTVVSVAAGDRLTYRTASGAKRTVRLAGVDAPGVEGASPRQFDGVLTGSRGRACLADQGRRSVRALRGRLLDETVTVRVVDERGTPTAVVTHDSRSINRHLVARGYVRATDGRYDDAERAARSATLGVWSCTLVEPDRPIRADASTGLRIAAVHPNPPGDDAAALNEEYVVIENTGRTTVDLSNWWLTVGDTVVLLDGPALHPGTNLVVHVGTGRDTDGHLYLGATRPLLGNAHGTLKLSDGDSNRSVRLTY
ncbi:lamin tail domain-containing protein [Haloplanus halobius]|uniref:lamin tail domain-containing protein n=1 Tax=Haloplanus halobius TaxID=2934938 RepID=UPI00200D23C7|nr:lamin tail domain-containing protein [Haloplanus sp. XH21]